MNIHNIRPMIMRLLAIASLLIFASPCFAQTTEINQTLLSPIFDTPYVCSEHAVGELPYPGDNLGQDCMIVELAKDGDAKFPRLYKTNGMTNEDWFGWNRPVHSPCNCVVSKVAINPKTNSPGFPDQSRASGVLLKANDGTMIVIAHIQNVRVKDGDSISVGDTIGSVGNNGYARSPHIHIGAWKGESPLQVRWDQRRMKVH